MLHVAGDEVGVACKRGTEENLVVGIGEVLVRVCRRNDHARLRNERNVLVDVLGVETEFRTMKDVLVLCKNLIVYKRSYCTGK